MIWSLIWRWTKAICNRANDKLEGDYVGLATIWELRLLGNDPCIFKWHQLTMESFWSARTGSRSCSRSRAMRRLRSPQSCSRVASPWKSPLRDHSSSVTDSYSSAPLRAASSTSASTRILDNSWLPRWDFFLFLPFSALCIYISRLLLLILRLNFF